MLSPSFNFKDIFPLAKINPGEKLQFYAFAKISPREITDFAIREIKSTRKLIHLRYPDPLPRELIREFTLYTNATIVALTSFIKIQEGY